MKLHSNDYKNNIKNLGREIDSKITYQLNGETIELGSEELNSVTPHYESALLKSVMKQLDIDSNVDIPLGSVLTYQFGLKVNGEYEYINFGNYVVYSSEKQEDTKSYKIICYDKMLYSMKDYEQLDITYPITIRNYINAICNHIGLTFKNASDTFANYNRTIPSELYLDSDGNTLNYTFRDVLDELAQVTASIICINEDDDELEIRYVNNTNDTINEEYLKDINVTFGQKYGPINSIVLSRGNESDNVYVRDEESVTQNGLCEIKIKDNQIMNFNNRSDYLNDILQVLDGFEYYINDFSSTGIGYYELFDRYNVQIDNNTYSCVMFNDEFLVTQGLQENIHSDLPEESETDYNRSTKDDRSRTRAEIIVDKVQGEVNILSEKIVDISESVSGVGSITLDNAYEGMLHSLRIKGQISLLFPQTQDGLYGYPLVPKDGLVPSNELTPSSPVPYGNEVLYPSQDLYPKGSVLLIDDERYILDFDFLNYMNNNICDEFVYEEGKTWIIRRVGIDDEGNMYELQNEVIEHRNDIILNVKNDSVIRLESFDNAILSSEYLTQNEYTDTFAPDYDLISRINLTPGKAEIDANKISLAGKEINLTSDSIIIESDNFSVSEEGHIKSVSGEIGGFNISDISLNKSTTGLYEYDNYDAVSCVAFIMGFLTSTQLDKNIFDLEGDGTIDSTDYVKIKNIINGDRENTQITNGIVYINSDNPKRCISVQRDGEIICSLGVEGINTNLLTGLKSVIGPLDATTSTSIITLDGKTATIRVGAINGNRTTITRDQVASPTITQTSLLESKKNITPFSKALSIIDDIDLYKYNLKSEEDNHKKHIGFIIGEGYNYSSEITAVDEENKEIGVDTYSMTSLCLQAIKEQQEIIKNLQKRIEVLENEKTNY